MKLRFPKLTPLQLQTQVTATLPPSAPSSIYTDNNRQSLPLIPRAAKKLLFTPSPDADNGTFNNTHSMPSLRGDSINLAEDNEYNEREEHSVTPKGRGKKLLEKFVPPLKATPNRPETPEMDPKAEQFFGKGSHERKKSHLFDKFKNKGKEVLSRSMLDLINKVEGPSRQVQFEESSTPLRHKHSRLPADLTDSPFWDLKQAQKLRIHSIRDARMTDNHQSGELPLSDQPSLETTSIARSTSLRYINDEMPPTPPSKDPYYPSAVLESKDPSSSSQRLQSTVVRSDIGCLADQDIDTGTDTINLPHVKQENVRIHQGSPIRNGGCAVKDKVKLIERQISYNSLFAEMRSSSPPPPVPSIPAVSAGDPLVTKVATNTNHQQVQTESSAVLLDAQVAGKMDVAGIPAFPIAELIGNTSLTETINQLRRARKNSTVFSIPEEDVEDTVAVDSGVVDPSNIHATFHQQDLASRPVSPSNYSTYTIGTPISFPDVVDMVNDNLRQGNSTKSGNRASLAPPPLRITSRSSEPVQEQPAADSSQRQSSMSWQSATSLNNEINERILRLEFRVDLLLSSAVMLVHNFRYLRDIQEDMQRRATHLEQLVNRMAAAFGEETVPATSAPASAPTDAPTPVDAPLGRRNSVIQRLANVYVANHSDTYRADLSRMRSRRH